jgi:hypothetical protein
MARPEVRQARGPPVTKWFFAGGGGPREVRTGNRNTNEKPVAKH